MYKRVLKIGAFMSCRQHLRLKLAVAFACSFAMGYASSGTPQERYLAMPFHTDTGEVRTTICVRVVERTYSGSAWWVDERGASDPEQRALAAIFTAIQRKDRNALQRLTGLGASNTAGSVIDQMLAQGEYLNSVERVRLYQFSNLLTAYASIGEAVPGGMALFVFEKRGAGYQYLLRRSEQLSYAFVREWANSSWGAKSPNPTYCSPEQLSRATHRVNLPDQLSGQTGAGIAVLLKGIDLTGSTKQVQPAGSVVAAYVGMQRAVKANDFNSLLNFIAPSEAARMRSWATAAESTAEREQVRQTLMQESPFFLFDAGELLVLYTRAKTETAPTVWYFVRDAKGNPRWSNVSRLDLLDSLFKRGALFEGSKRQPPFKSLELAK